MDTSPPAVENRLNAFRQRCAAAGLAVTPQRVAIYQVLAADDAHPSAEVIFRRLKPGMPMLSLGTVYRTLELLEEHGLVSRLHTFGEQALFDANLEPHQHLVCIRCRNIADLKEPGLQRLPIREEALDGFQVLNHRIQLLGICATCQQAGP